MNKVLDERIVPNGEYIDALNIRMGSTELSETGVIENAKGNEQLTTVEYLGSPISNDAVCIGVLEDGARETMYWFVHDPNNILSASGKVDMILSFNTSSSVLRYHVVSETILNFNPKYLINAVNLVDDLLFFTDNYNPPRFININRTYLQPLAGVDQIIPEELLVIKQRPVDSPVVVPIIGVSSDNYMQDRFICFAYRYRYEDNQYSATSQFSQPAFIPGPFSFTPDSFLNGGMQNLATDATISVQTGNFMVKGIDILFKEASSNIINVVVKLDKADLGIANDTTYTYTFGDSKIFTILPDYELLRLYDNVPKLAKAQTVMGNRLMYGNYYEGYDPVDEYGSPLKIEYTTELISEDLENIELSTSLDDAQYSIDIPTTVAQGSVNIDFAGFANNLKEGYLFSFSVDLTHALFTSGTINAQTLSIRLSFSYSLPQDYNTLLDFINSNGFRSAIGTVLNIQTPIANCGLGDTLTDRFNCEVPQTLDTYTKQFSGISAADQPIVVQISPSNPNAINMYFPAVAFLDGSYVYEYYKIQSIEATLQTISSTKSLHSNRGYEIGIVYMDEFGRSSTPYVSLNNTVFIECARSAFRNYIKVTIPTSQIAPAWAKRYKLFIKQDLDTYETIYCTVFFPDPETNSTWFLLDGENGRKVEEGDRLTVKADSDGPVSSCSYATVLEKKVQNVGFLPDPPYDYVPSGVYVRMLPTTFNAVYDPTAYIDLSLNTTTCEGDSFPLMKYAVTQSGNPIDIPAGSRVKFYIEFYRRGPGSGNRACERRHYTFEQEFISSASYSSFYQFFLGEHIADVLNNGTQDNGSGSCDLDNYFNPILVNTPPPPQNCFRNSLPLLANNCKATYQFYQGTAPGDDMYLVVGGGVWACGSNWKREASIKMHIQIYQASHLLIFETQPIDTLPDIFFESSQSFEIDSLGQHAGNVQYQNFLLNAPAIIDADFYNCYSFGNGAESYKILDSAAGKHFNLGNRVTATSSKDYMEVHRYADITYSGTYNDESNINRLNEFNLGLVNYKPLENSFGAIQVLFARETDVLCLQEDKISYVLSGKNLLSDAAAGGTITSVPEVLGTQMARLEEYGISSNPESFAVYGYDKYFSDSKRGAVLKLSGSAYSNDQLSVVSESGMRTWFRDLFISDFDKQKIGGYDAYMNEYVLSANNNYIPIDVVCIDCNTTQNVQVNAPIPGTLSLASEICFDYGSRVGDVTIEIIYDGPSQINVQSVYNGGSYSTGPITSNQTLIFPKDIIQITTGFINIYAEEDCSVTLQVSCPGAKRLNVIQVCVSNNARAGQFIHNEYNYSSGTYTGPMMSTLVNILPVTLHPMVSYYNMISGFQGDPYIPIDGSSVVMRSNKIGFDNMQFDPAGDRFAYLRTSVLYANTPAQISTLISLAPFATPINTTGTPDLFYSSFTMPTMTPADEYLYLIWLYDAGTRASLCYSDAGAYDACCTCICANDCESYIVGVPPPPHSTPETVEYVTCNGLNASLTLNPGESQQICVKAGTLVAPDGVVITLMDCGCSDDLPKPSSFTNYGNFYRGYTEPYQPYVSYTSSSILDSVCQANDPIDATVYDFTLYYFVTGSSISIGTVLYDDDIGTPSTFSGVLIFTPIPKILPNDILSATIIYVFNGVITGYTPATTYLSSC